MLMTDYEKQLLLYRNNSFIMLYRFFSFIFIFNLLVVPVLSQDESLGNACSICKNGEHDNNSPYNKGCRIELPFFIASVGLMSSGFILQSINKTEAFSVSGVNNLDRYDVNPFDRPATYNWDTKAASASDYMAVGAMVLPAILLCTHHTRSDIGNLILMGLEVGFINYGFTLSVKNITNRTRPYVYNSDAPITERTSSYSRLSFFSAHTSNTAAVSFFFAKVMSDYHPNMKTGLKVAIWSAAIAVPSATAYFRVESGKHFKTDVITGFVVGATTGWLIPHLHKKKSNESAFSIFPTSIFGTPGMFLSYRL